MFDKGWHEQKGTFGSPNIMILFREGLTDVKVTKSISRLDGEI